MTNSVQDLVGQLVAAGEWPAPDLLNAIVAQGDAAIEPLTALLSSPEAEGWPLHYAAYLLAHRQARSAIPALANVFRLYDSDFLESIAEALSVFRAESVEPALAVAQASDLRWYPRAMAVEAAVDAAAGEPAQREHVAAVLRDMLADYVSRSGSLSEDEADMVTSLVTDLARLADPQARELIRAAFEADLVETLFIDPETVDEYYRRGGAATEQFDPQAWLKDYPRAYQRSMDEAAREAKRRERERQPVPRAGPAPAMHLATPSGPRPGRNEPCWCGSGKKYKLCHLEQDEQRQPGAPKRKRRR
jgi:hypothetical protein